MSYSAMQWKAIKAFMDANQLRPQLSAFPVVRFTRKDGAVVEKNIQTLVDWYNAERDRTRREKRPGA